MWVRRKEFEELKRLVDVRCDEGIMIRFKSMDGRLSIGEHAVLTNKEALQMLIDYLDLRYEPGKCTAGRLCKK